MTKLNSNMLLGIFIGLIFLSVIYYLKTNDQPIKNSGSIDEAVKIPVNPPVIDNRSDGLQDDLVDSLIAQYTVEDRPMDGSEGTFSASDPMASDYGSFRGYGTKRQINMRKMEEPLSEDKSDPRDFSYKKKKFTTRTPADTKDLFDVDKMLPKEKEEGWFDVEPLMSTKKIKGTHLIHPKVHMGVNTVGNTLKNGTHDIRGDIPNPRINVSPWNNSSIEPDTNIRGICNPN